MNTKNEKKIRVGAYIPEVRAEEIEEIAEKKDRSKNWITSKAIEIGLDEMKKEVRE